jgi:hypothetical protein
MYVDTPAPAVKPPEVFRLRRVSPGPTGSFAGCVLEGAAAGSTTLAVSPDPDAPVFATLHRGQVAVRFGDADGSGALIAATLEKIEFRAYASKDGVTVFAQHRIQRQGVYEPYARTPLAARASSANAVAIEPRLVGDADVRVRWRNPTPWLVPCASVGLALSSFEAPNLPAVLSRASLRGVTPLSDKMRGVTVVDLPGAISVAVVRVLDGEAFVRWDAPEGVYRGWIRREALQGGAGLSGFGEWHGRVGRVIPDPCALPVELAVADADGQAWLVGTVPARVPVRTLEVDSHSASTSDPGSNLVPMLASAGEPASEWYRVRPPDALELRPGFTLFARRVPGSCRDPVPTGATGDR